MDAHRVDIQRPATNWLRTMNRNLGFVGAGALLLAGPATVQQDGIDPTPVHNTRPDAVASGAPPRTNAQPDQSVESCQWANREGQRQPLVNTKPATVRVDAACDPDPAAPVGIYPTAKQEGQPIALANTDDTLTVHCYVTNGEPIQDARGEATEGDQRIGSSAAWLKVTDQDGVIGKIPTTWTGFTDIVALRSLGIKECR